MFSILENQHRLLSSIEMAQKLLNYKPQMKSVYFNFFQTWINTDFGSCSSYVDCQRSFRLRASAWRRPVSIRCDPGEAPRMYRDFILDFFCRAMSGQVLPIVDVNI